MEKPIKKRIFISIPIPSDIVTQIRNVSEEIKTKAEIPRIPENNLHITLYFIGETSSELINLISENLLRVATNSYKFILSSGKTEIKEKGDKRGLIWIEIKKEESLTILHDRILKELDWLPRVNLHASFKPHITISRYKPYRTGSLKSISIPHAEFSFPVKKIQLMESILGRKGSAYQVLESFSLQDRHN